MISAGTRLKSTTGKVYEVEKPLPAGGQATPYIAIDRSTGRRVVAKVFLGASAPSQLVQRTEFLKGQELGSACTTLVAPFDVLVDGGRVGHVSSFAPGTNLEDVLQEAPVSLVHNLQLALALARSVEVLHARQIAHGDLHAENLLIDSDGEVLQLSVIDLDNFSAPSTPPPPCIGHSLYMAPELRDGTVAPSVRSDLFALGILLHEIILFFHPVSGADATQEEFQEAICAGWIHDPARSERPEATGGYSVKILNDGLDRLFRSSLSPNPGERPPASAWVSALKKAIQEVFECPRCGYPTIVDASKTRCPGCEQRYPVLTLAGPGFSSSVRRGAMPVGRAQLGGAPTISDRHAILRRIGPETWIESRGLNGTYRRVGDDWIRLPNGKSVLLQAGDRLRLAEYEMSVNSGR